MSWPQIYSTGVIAFFNSLSFDESVYVLVGGFGALIMLALKETSLCCEFGLSNFLSYFQTR